MQTLPKATVVVAMSSSKESELAAGAITLIGFVPRPYSTERLGKTNGEVFVNDIP